MVCNSKCEIIEWKTSNPHLVKEVASPNVNIDDAKLLAMVVEKIIKENSSKSDRGCLSGCECAPVGKPKIVWKGDRY